MERKGHCCRCGACCRINPNEYCRYLKWEGEIAVCSIYKNKEEYYYYEYGCNFYPIETDQLKPTCCFYFE